jgi:hypothetical protein
MHRILINMIRTRIWGRKAIRIADRERLMRIEVHIEMIDMGAITMVRREAMVDRRMRLTRGRLPRRRLRRR